jgi:O-antigen ligase
MIVHSILTALFALCFAIVLMTDGGVYPLTVSLAAVLMALVLAVASLRQPWPKGRAWPLVTCLMLWLLVVGWTILQTLPLPGETLANPAWSTLRQAIAVPSGSVQGRISVAPDDSLYAIIPISLPFVTFMAAFLLFRTDREVAKLWRVIGVVGGCLAVFAIVQSVVFPDTLMFSRKEAYLGSLTAPFVNRNTAATFYGVVALVLASQTLLSLRDGPAQQTGRAGGSSSEARIRDLFLFGSLALASLVALALTQSRGGALSAFVGFAVFLLGTGFTAGVKTKAVGPGRFFSSTPGRQGVAGKFGRRRIFVVVIALVCFAALAFLLLGRAVLRAERQGPEDSRFCIYRGVIDAIDTNLWQGIGAGSFRYYFAAFRSPECGIVGGWFRAHDVYLDTVLALGLPLGILVIATIAAALTCLLARGMMTRRRQRPIILAMIAATVLVAIHACLDFSLQIPGFALLFALMAALTANVSLNRSGKSAR